MGKTIGIVNTKGGVGKTTVASTLGNELARKGYKTLMIDFDPQASLTLLSGLIPKNYKETKHDICNIYREQPIEPIELKPNLYIIPSNEKLRYFAESGFTAKETYLDLFIKGDEVNEVPGIADDFDFIIIDSAGGGGTLESSVYIASDAIVIPIRPTFLDETGTILTIQNILKTIKGYRKKDLLLLGFIAVDFDRRFKAPMERYAKEKSEVPALIRKYQKLFNVEDVEDIFIGELHRRAVWQHAANKGMFIQDYIEKYDRAYSTDVLLSIEAITNKILEKLSNKPALV